MFFLISPTFTLICFLVSLVCLWPKEQRWWRLFILYLALSVSAEFGGYHLFFVKGQNNHWVFNAFLPLEISFLFFMLYRICRPYFRKPQWIAVAWAIFIAIYFWQSIGSGFKALSSDAMTFAWLVIIVICFLFYYQLMKQDHYMDLTHYPAFWLISGLFIFCLGTTACSIFQTQLTQVYKSTGLPVRYIIMMVLNFMLYAGWSYAFICRYRQKISSS